MAASRSEALARGRATYQDVIDAPAHLVAEIVDGTLHTHPRPARGACTSKLGAGWKNRRSIRLRRRWPWRVVDLRRAGAAPRRGRPGAGSSRAGAASACRSSPRRRYVPLAPDWACEDALALDDVGSTCRKSDRSTRARASVTCGSLNRRTGRLRRSSSGKGSGCSSRCAKDDEPVSIRPFDAITFSLGDLWP